MNDALSVSGAIFLILELDSPFSGLLQIFDAPLRNAIAHIGHYPDTALAVTQIEIGRVEMTPNGNATISVVAARADSLNGLSGPTSEL